MSVSWPVCSCAGRGEQRGKTEGERGRNERVKMGRGRKGGEGGRGRREGGRGSLEEMDEMQDKKKQL